MQEGVPARDNLFQASRQCPGAIPSSDQSPTCQRTSRRQGSPTWATMRRTCRLRPSVSVTRSQASGTVLRNRTGGSRGQRSGSMLRYVDSAAGTLRKLVQQGNENVWVIR